ncbi:MAG: hypothetical protein COV74_00830 [Candidatus Omnitrophica bacterium CG11_big_fil_rev_8_21_14_0_20_45_26]|uniref:AAA family ATPase n=1 Tax=Candidatus Abzuiibacterium crystallinum TaxID=1974748 RepID=A0A2H0LSN0_9BACT|nr:MAG: hypothetical protein COV74_00830 [Candidatus Omnitrophica bacterium CG11_big_fil_rev_8_21_14_0_20_45_26]
MRYIKRGLEKEIVNAARHFPALAVTGPRRAGKTCLLRHLFPKANYVLLEDTDLVGRIQSDPHGYLDDLERPVILDEIQNAPFLFPYIRTRIDQKPKRKGEWLLTGSQEAPLMQGVTESMSGRIALFQLLPFSYRERKQWDLLRGSFPEAVANPSIRNTWFRSYIQTYLERDVRQILAVRDLPTFRRFLTLLATKHGQVLNKTALASPLGLSVPTVTQWLNVLEMTSQILIVPPFYENFKKRLIKSPKIYWTDSGLVGFILGIENTRLLKRSPFYGALFEGFVASEVVKNQLAQGRPKELYYFRDEQGLEVDFVIPEGEALHLVEVKASSTVSPAAAKPLLKLAKSIRKRKVRCTVVHRKSKAGTPMHALTPGVRAFTVEEFLGT